MRPPKACRYREARQSESSAWRAVAWGQSSSVSDSVHRMKTDDTMSRGLVRSIWSASDWLLLANEQARTLAPSAATVARHAAKQQNRRRREPARVQARERHREPRRASLSDLERQPTEKSVAPLPNTPARQSRFELAGWHPWMRSWHRAELMVSICVIPNCWPAQQAIPFA